MSQTVPQGLVGNAGTNPAASDLLADRVFMPEGDAAEFLTLSNHSLRRYRRVGGGPPYIQLGPGRIAYLMADLMAWAKSRRVTNTAEGEAVAQSAGR